MAKEVAKAIFIDALTGEVTERNLTTAELAEAKTDADLAKIELQAKTDAKASALAKLEALGLTAEEIAAL